MTSSDKLRFLLIRQFVYLGATIGMLALLLTRSQFAYMFALFLCIGLIKFVMPRLEKKLRESEVRLSPRQKHIYFGVGLVYFFRDGRPTSFVCGAAFESTRVGSYELGASGAAGYRLCRSRSHLWS
jgi:hypothetical protein